jgi:hypothetical protein
MNTAHQILPNILPPQNFDFDPQKQNRNIGAQSAVWKTDTVFLRRQCGGQIPFGTTREKVAQFSFRKPVVVCEPANEMQVRPEAGEFFFKTLGTRNS